MKGTFLIVLLDTGKRRSVYIVYNKDLHRGVVLIVFLENARSNNFRDFRTTWDTDKTMP
jgi:hypothetical protein